MHLVGTRHAINQSASANAGSRICAGMTGCNLDKNPWGPDIGSQAAKDNCRLPPHNMQAHAMKKHKSVPGEFPSRLIERLASRPSCSDGLIFWQPSAVSDLEPQMARLTHRGHRKTGEPLPHSLPPHPALRLRPSPLYAGLQLVFDGLCDEAWAIQTVILAIPATNAEDLHTQAAIARDYMADHLPDMPLLEQFIERVEAYAA